MIPYSTDAPIYHWPIATVSLIALNVLVFIATAGYDHAPRMVLVDANGREVSDAELERLYAEAEANGQDEDEFWDSFDFVERGSGGTLLLQYGAGLKPWQWLTSIFMHAGIGHLLGNMIFLWAFGLIVEGKIGWLPFTLLYLAIGCGQSAVEQLIMLTSDGGASLGASAAIFGLLGVAMMWAPRNDFDCLWRFGTIEIPVLAFAGMKFALEGVGVMFQGFAMSGSLLHLMGAAFGLVLGGVWIKRGWVDCEGYDLFSVIAGDEGRRSERESFDQEAHDLVADVYRKKAAQELHTPAPATPRAFPPAMPFGPVASAAPVTSATPRPSVATRSPAARVSPAAASGETPAPVFRPQPTIPDFDSLDDIFGSGPAVIDEDSLEQRIINLETALQENRFAEVPALLQAVRELDVTYEIAQAPLLRWIESLLASKQYPAAVPLMNQHIRRFQQKRPAMQVQLAKVLLQLKQPQQALKALQRIDLGKLSATGKATVQQLIARAATVAGSR